MVNLDEIAASCPERLEALIFGVADYAASIQSHTASIGGSDAGYAVLTDPNGDAEVDRELHWGDQWHYPLARIAVTCRAHGLRPIDGPFGDFGDADGYTVAARRASILGFEGKWCIHPSQIELANEVFSPNQRLVSRTRRIMAAMEEAAAGGQGRGLPRRPADRRGLAADGRAPARQDRADRGAGERLSAAGRRG